MVSALSPYEEPTPRANNCRRFISVYAPVIVKIRRRSLNGLIIKRSKDRLAVIHRQKPSLFFLTSSIYFIDRYTALEKNQEYGKTIQV